MKVGAGTLASRLLGLVREVVSAGIFGASASMDMFFLAFRVPNLFRRLFGEGALTAAFVPEFTREGAAPQGDPRRLLSVVMTALAALLVALTVLGWAACAVALLGFDLSEKWRLFWTLLAVMLPYLPLICLSALQGAALNVKGRFMLPALVPTLMNACWIVAALLSGRVEWLAWAILLSGLLQYGVQVPVLWRLGLRMRPTWDLMHPGLRRIGRHMLPVVFGLGLVQVNTAVDGFIAQFCVPGDGANSVLAYGSDLMQFPLGVLGLALATAVFPALARHAVERDRQGMVDSVNLSLRAAIFLALPCMAVAAALSVPIVRMLLERGAFGPESTLRTAHVFFYYSLGLWAFCGVHVLARSFYAHGDMAAPVRIAAWLVGANLALNLALVWPMREAGLALASALCGAANLCLLYRALRRHTGPLGGRALLGSALKCLLAAVIAGAAGYAVARGLGLWLGASPAPARPALGRQVAGVGAALAATGLAYLGAAWLLRVRELREFVAAVTKRR